MAVMKLVSAWNEPERFEPAYVGRVLRLHFESVRVMSDVWDTALLATVWDGEKVKQETVWVNDWRKPGQTADVDATPEVLAAARAWLVRANLQSLTMDRARELTRREEEAQTPVRGSWVTVVRGRKVPRGAEGPVIWVGEGQWGTRVGFTDASGVAQWTAIGNVEVKEWEALVDRTGLRSDAELREAAEREAEATLASWAKEREARRAA